MRERLRPFGGDLQISSREAGTRVAVSIPLSRPDAPEQIEPARAAM
jgi:signal transduction histidine kinase